MFSCNFEKFGESFYVNGDCINVMKEMKSLGMMVNAVIVDPPYGIGHTSNRRGKDDDTTRCGILNDVNNEGLLGEAIELANDLMVDGSHIYWFTRWDMLDVQMPMLRKYFKLKNVLIWDKGNHGSGDLLGAYGNRYECVVFGVKGKKDLNVVDGKQRHDDILNYSKIHASNLIHPHQKPVDLLGFLMMKSTKEGDLVLDMFGGVGSTICAALKNGRKCVAIELDEKVWEKGKEYINNNHNENGISKLFW